MAAALLTVIGAIGMLIDPRIVLGMPNWAKSTKFGISLSLYGATLLWMLPMITKWPRLARFVATGIGGTLLIEIILLVVQATRGVPMHFNVSTPLDTALWGAMSFTIVIFWLFTALGVVLLLFQKLPNRVLAWSVRLGLLLTLIGFTEGFLMTGPNAPQRAALEAGQQLDLIGAHTVGGFDGGPGLPFAGWSTNHGDLRIGHFAGIHAAQIIPLLGILLLRRREKVAARRPPPGVGGDWRGRLPGPDSAADLAGAARPAAAPARCADARGAGRADRRHTRGCRGNAAARAAGGALRAITRLTS